jgi:hypothetical protein
MGRMGGGYCEGEILVRCVDENPELSLLSSTDASNAIEEQRICLRAGRFFALSLRYVRSAWSPEDRQAKTQIRALPIHSRSSNSPQPEVRPMFSGFAVYLGDKIVLMLCDSPKQPEDNGVWIVFSEVANLTDAGIRRDFPSLRIIGLPGGKIDHWRLIPADSPTFESEALHACELLLKHDLRIGRVPQSRQTRPGRPRNN